MLLNELEEAVSAEVSANRIYFDSKTKNWFCNVETEIQMEHISFVPHRVLLTDTKFIQKKNFELNQVLNRYLWAIHGYIKALLNNRALQQAQLQSFSNTEFQETKNILEIIHITLPKAIKPYFNHDVSMEDLQSLLFGKELCKPVRFADEMKNLWIRFTLSMQEDTTTLCPTIDIVVSKNTCEPQHMQLYHTHDNPFLLKLKRLDL